MNKTLIPILILLSGAAIIHTSSTLTLSVVRLDRATLMSTPIFVPDNYSTIQEAINAANPGDVIYVENGTYYENIFINKTATLIGKDPGTTVIDGSRSDESFAPVIWIGQEEAKDTVLQNFTVTGSQNAWGVYILGAPNVTVENNIIINNHGGINLDGSNDHTITNNTIANNLYEGLLLFQSSGNTLRNNTINGNFYNFGILESAFDNDIDQTNLINEKPIYYLTNQTDTTINPTTHPQIGYLALINCLNVTVENLSLNNNYNGIIVAGSNSINLTNNVFTHNAIGIHISESAENVLQGNTITDSWRGLSLANSSDNTFKQNNLTANTENIRIKGSQLSHFLHDMDASNTVDRKLVSYLINQTDLVVNPDTFPNTGYLALINCDNVTASTLQMQNNTLLVAFSRNCTIAESNLDGGEISLQHASYVNAYANNLSDGEGAITIEDSDNNTILMNNMTRSGDHGVSLKSSVGNTVTGNNIIECKTGIELLNSNNNTIVENNVTSNAYYGILLTQCHFNAIYHNNFVNNSGSPDWQAVSSNFPMFGGDNSWDNGYPSGGNYWNDPNSTDQYSGSEQNVSGSDAIVDTPHTVPFGEADRYPLAGPYRDFTVENTQTLTFNVEIISNSSVSDPLLVTWLSSPTPYIQPGQQFLQFSAAGQTNITGFCRVTIPRDLLNGTYLVLVDWNPVPVTELAASNSTHAFLYFTYAQSTHEIAILPEYTGIVMIIMTLAAATITVALTRWKNRKAL